MRSRLSYLCQVGLGYLTLDRQSRTLSGGEVQRINLTTALGTSLVNTLFVLDEPSIGLHPRDMGRVIDVMKRLRDAGNSLVVVEHDPQIMLEADKLLDMGPGPGERGGEIVFFGPPDALKRASTVTAEYLSGRRRADSGRWRPVPPRCEDVRVSSCSGATEHNLQQHRRVVPAAPPRVRDRRVRLGQVHAGAGRAAPGAAASTSASRRKRRARSRAWAAWST